MHNVLNKRILEADEVSLLTPVREKLLVISQNIAQEYEVVSFDGRNMKLAILTTNKHSEALKKIYEGLKKAGYELDIYYTSKEGIDIALTWYDKVEQDRQDLARKQQTQRDARGENAIKQIERLYGERSTMDPSVFVEKLIRYGFQS